MRTAFRQRSKPARGAKLLALLAVSAAAFLSSCAVGVPKQTSGVTLTAATLHGDIYSTSHGTTEYWWRYGGTPTYGLKTPDRTVVINDESAHPVSEPIGGLASNTTYHFQLCARDEEEVPPRTNCSRDQTFSTASAIGGSRIAGVVGAGTIFAMDPDGSDRTLLNDSGRFAWPAWSPDGSKIAFAGTTSSIFDSEVFVMDADGSDQTRLTSNPASDGDPAWSPDGGRIAFTSGRDGNNEIYVMDADGSDQTRLTDDGVPTGDPAWSPVPVTSSS